ncbi:hypothetical protein KJ807_05690 [Patescibacteria group bacterium]|nr:hypothetical protein [Patescibacteria group bacterium]
MESGNEREFVSRNIMYTILHPELPLRSLKRLCEKYPRLTAQILHNNEVFPMTAVIAANYDVLEVLVDKGCLITPETLNLLKVQLLKAQADVNALRDCESLIKKCLS